MAGLNSKKFIAYLFALSVVLYGTLYALRRLLILPEMPINIMLPLLFVVTAGTFLILVQTKDKNPRLFVFSYMIISFSRLIIYGAFIFVYALAHRQGAKYFAVTFLLLYFMYSATEIWALRKNL